MIQIEYTFEGLDEAIRDIEDAMFGLPASIHQMLLDWGQKFLETAKAYPFPKQDRMRAIDGRVAPRGPQGRPRFRDFWKGMVDPVDNGAKLDIWNEHPNAKFVLFPTAGHTIPRGGSATMREKGYPLRWFDERGGVHTRWEVWHPPMTAIRPTSPLCA